jgi:hypothetical protein
MLDDNPVLRDNVLCCRRRKGLNRSETLKMAFKITMRTATIAVFLCAPTLAQQLDFENLPGVESTDSPALPFEDANSGPEAECTTAFEPLGLEDTTPKRVYKCRKGNITITSEDPPPGY